MIFMDKKDKASISIMKIIGVSLIIILLLGVTVRATETSIRTVEITLANGYKMSVITSKTNVYEILEDNNIFVEEDERVSPGLDDDINESNKIVITNKSVQEVQIAKISESGIETTLDEILKGYSPIVEKIEVEQEIIPYETITKDAAQGSEDTKNKVIQQGEDGIKEITYKVKYQNEEEIEKIFVDDNSELLQNLDKNGLNIDGRTKIALMEASVGLATIVTFIAIYLGIIFLIASSAILALKQLTDSSDNKQRYTILRKIGCDEKMINKALFRQIGIFFGVPLVLAIIHSIFGIQFAITIMSGLASKKDLLPSAIATVIIIGIIYGIYFLATYLGSKNIIKEDE